MGWANCGTDSKGRPIGYAHAAKCDAPGCKARIHRGLAYACGGEHGEGSYSCEGYFCEQHRKECLPCDFTDYPQQVCDKCHAYWRTYAIEHPDDADELVAFFEEEEGEDWKDSTEVRP